MLYRVHVTVLRAERARRSATSKNTWHDAAAWTFGINSESSPEAIEWATAAAENAFDRNGDFLGGIVVETACRCVERREFDGHAKHFHRPINKPGIFYVSGISHFRLPGFGNAEALAALKKTSRRSKSSAPPPSGFVHPRSPDEPSERTRLLCSVCKRWMEVESDELLCVFMASPLDEFTAEEKKIWRSVNVVGPFVRRHMTRCLFTVGEPRGAVVAIHEPDPQWDKLDPEKQEKG